MNQLEEDVKEVSQLNNTHYEHTILVSKSVLSKIELFTLTALSICLYFGYFRNDIRLGGNLKVVSVFLYLLIFLRLLVRIFCGVKVGEFRVPVKSGSGNIYYCLSHLGGNMMKEFSMVNKVGVETSVENFKNAESIFIVKALGLQTTAVYHSNFKSLKFIPWHSINDVIINEAIVMQRVIYYLAVLVKSEEKEGGESIIPIFIHAQPRLTELKKIYSNIQLILRN